MNLLLDLGNTRLKWAVASEVSGVTGRLEQRGVVNYDATALFVWATQLLTLPIHNLKFSSVIAPEQEEIVFSVLKPLALKPARFQVGPHAGSLRNDYARPETLGVDRWAAAIGAWGLVGQSCLVINAGTATTIDLVESLKPDAAVYRGGLILPGLALMLQSLHQRAARLPEASGQYCAAPAVANNTHDAITSGAIEATCGAIERMGRRLSVSSPWVLTGGNAMQLQTVLGSRVCVVEDLVLEGLALHTLISK